MSTPSPATHYKVRQPKHAKSGGLIWDVVSRNERAITFEGRHFFATRCEPSALWTMLELDEPTGGREIGRCNCLAETAELSFVVETLVKHSHLHLWQIRIFLILRQAALSEKNTEKAR